ncbi:MAG: protein kinase [Gemmatimonadaceae bacterium]
MTSDLQERLQATLGGAYRIERELGGGGMSRVYLAEDSELGRKIVIKVLPPELAAGLNVERFRREIQLAAKLQHPHIVPLLAAGARDGLLYFTMPFITGESLRTRVTRQHELPIHDAVRVLRDVVDALAYAHANGVVHRDIKPDNVLLSGNHAVVTDFGVSKALSNSTGSSTLTSMGVALGTPAYMSPEQAAADPSVDHRADIYAVGALAYELLTGRQVFVAPTPQQVLSAHIQLEPDPLSKYRNAVSPALEQVIMRCLAKKPADRWQNAEQLLSQLEALATPSGGMTPQPMQPVRAKRTPWALIVTGGAVVILGGVVAWLAAHGSSAESIAIGATNQVTNTPGLELDPALSPDGKLLAYATGQPGRMRIQVRQISGGRVLDLTTGLAGEHRLPQWSPDGSRVLFLARGQMYTVPAFGGTPSAVGRATSLVGMALGFGIGAAWSPDGKQLAHTIGDTIFIGSSDGGVARTLTVHTSPHSLSWSPDGTRIAFVSENPQFAYGGTAAFGNLGPNSIWTIAPGEQGGVPTRLTAPGALYASPVWMPDSRELLYVSNAGGARDIYAQRVNARGNADGQPRRLTTGLGAHGISLSRDATRLAYSVLQYRTNIHSAPIGPGVTPSSAIAQITDENQAVEGIGVTPDGKWLVYDSNRGGNSDIYKVPASGGEPIQLTTDPADDFIPQWSRDGQQVVFHSWRTGNRDVFVMNANGGDLQRVTSDTVHDMYPDFAPDGKRVVYYHGTNTAASGRSVGGLFVGERQDAGTWAPERPLLPTGAAATMARWTHDGQQVVFLSGGDLRIVDAVGGAPRTLIPAGQLNATMNSTGVGTDRSLVYVRAVDSTGVHAFYGVDRGTGKARLLMRLDDPRRRARRHEFATDSRRLFFTLSEDESDIWVTELRKP